eukprot:scaffold4407_cov123-Isochrysis_galbana.AAC.7
MASRVSSTNPSSRSLSRSSRLVWRMRSTRTLRAMRLCGEALGPGTGTDLPPSNRSAAPVPTAPPPPPSSSPPETSVGPRCDGRPRPHDDPDGRGDSPLAPGVEATPESLSCSGFVPPAWSPRECDADGHLGEEVVVPLDDVGPLDHEVAEDVDELPPRSGDDVDLGDEPNESLAESTTSARVGSRIKRRLERFSEGQEDCPPSDLLIELLRLQRGRDPVFLPHCMLRRARNVAVLRNTRPSPAGTASIKTKGSLSRTSL